MKCIIQEPDLVVSKSHYTFKLAKLIYKKVGAKQINLFKTNCVHQGANLINKCIYILQMFVISYIFYPTNSYKSSVKLISFLAL